MRPYELLEALRRSIAETFGLTRRTLYAFSPVEITRDMALEVKSTEGCSYIQAIEALRPVNGDIVKARLRLRKMGQA